MPSSLDRGRRAAAAVEEADDSYDRGHLAEQRKADAGNEAVARRILKGRQLGLDLALAAQSRMPVLSGSTLVIQRDIGKATVSEGNGPWLS